MKLNNVSIIKLIVYNLLFIIVCVYIILAISHPNPVDVINESNPRLWIKQPYINEKD